MQLNDLESVTDALLSRMADEGYSQQMLGNTDMWYAKEIYTFDYG